MNFEINDGREDLPPEEDIYGVNDIEERERFEALFGTDYMPQEERIRRRKMRMRILAVALVVAFGSVFAFVIRNFICRFF